MRNIFALIGLAVVLFAVVGYARGWYSFNMTASTNGTKRIELDVDTKKVKSDSSDFAEKTGEFVESFRKSNGSAAGPK